MDDPIRERTHRLAREAYRGEVAVVFTLCVHHRVALFEDGRVVHAFLGELEKACAASDCLVPIYCFMPDHLHVMTLGRTPHADGWSAIVRFKQRTGFWLAQRSCGTRWQKGFFDHVLRSDEDLAAQARYIAENPVRRGLVAKWASWSFTGAIGLNLGDVLLSVSCIGSRR